MSNIITQVNTLKEFSKTHYTTLILEHQLNTLITPPNFDISIKKDGPILIYNIQLPVDFDYTNKALTYIIEHYKTEAVYAALCLSCLLPTDKTCVSISSYFMFPQVEWYVKETDTDEVIASSDNAIYLGGQYNFLNPKKAVNFSGDNKSYMDCDLIGGSLGANTLTWWTTDSKNTVTCLVTETPQKFIYYGREFILGFAFTPLCAFYTLSDIELIVDKSLMSKTSLFGFIENKNLIEPKLSYGYLLDRANHPKFALLGEINA
jgi:hypothetical protein